MATALFAPPGSIAPGLAGALGVLGRTVDELPWGGDLRSGVTLAGQDVLVTVAPRPLLGPLAAIEPAAWTAAIRDIAERPAAAARSLLRDGGKRWIAIIPHLSSLPSPGSGPYGAGGIMLQTMLRVAVIENAASGFCANAIAVAPFAGVLDADAETILRADTPRGDLTTLEELAALVHWLAGEAPESLNGETLKLDGGFSLTRKPRPAPSAAVEEWLVEPEWRG
jgi:NAD(P)-dependent dehydrogenase (short-subunit alcohol dehydrogenase family)